MKTEIVETDDGPMEQVTMDEGKTVILRPVSGNGETTPPPPPPPAEEEPKPKAKKGSKS